MQPYINFMTNLCTLILSYTKHVIIHSSIQLLTYKANATAPDSKHILTVNISLSLY